MSDQFVLEHGSTIFYVAIFIVIAVFVFEGYLFFHGKKVPGEVSSEMPPQDNSEPPHSC